MHLKCQAYNNRFCIKFHEGSIDIFLFLFCSHMLCLAIANIIRKYNIYLFAGMDFSVRIGFSLVSCTCCVVSKLPNCESDGCRCHFYWFSVACFAIGNACRGSGSLQSFLFKAICSLLSLKIVESSSNLQCNRFLINSFLSTSYFHGFFSLKMLLLLVFILLLLQMQIDLKSYRDA